MIKQEKDYLAKRKKAYASKSLLWATLVGSIFIIGWYVTQQRANHFTLGAAILVLPLALNVTRGMAYRKYRDADPKWAEVLEEMKGSYHLFHSVLIPDVTSILNYEHVVVTSRAIYMITSDETIKKETQASIEAKLEAKGIAKKQCHVLLVKEIDALKKVVRKIEKDAFFVDEHLNQYSEMIEQMIM